MNGNIRNLFRDIKSNNNNLIKVTSEYIIKNILFFISCILIAAWVIFGTCHMWKYGNWSTGSIISSYYQIIYGEGLFFYTQVAPLFVIVPAVVEYAMDFRTQNIKNKLNRMSFDEYMKEKYKSTYKYGFIYVFAALLMLIGACVAESSINIAKNFDLNLGISINAYLYILIYLAINYLYGVFYARLSLYMSKKNRSVMISIILTFLVYFFLQVIGEIFIGDIICSIILNLHSSYIVEGFALWSQFQMYDVNLIIFIIYSIVLFTLMSIFTKRRYSNLEELLIECEK